MATKAAIQSKKKSTIVKKVSPSTVKPTQSVIEMYKSICKTIKGMPIVGKLVVEFLGAFLLTTAFIEMQGNPLFIGFALAGIVLFVGVGLHANPAVTVGAWFTKKITLIHAIGYIIVQLLGAATAYLVLNTFLNANESSAQLSAAAPSLFHAAEVVKGKEWYLFFTELLGSSVLALGVASALRSKGNKTVAAFSAGFAILLALYVAMSITTVLLNENGVTLTFLNPAIAFALNGLEFKAWTLSIYVLAPALGGIIGFAVQEFLRCQDDEDCNCETCK